MGYYSYIYYFIEEPDGYYFYSGPNDGLMHINTIFYLGRCVQYISLNPTCSSFEAMPLIRVGSEDEKGT